jgi:hypothetical protein
MSSRCFHARGPILRSPHAAALWLPRRTIIGRSRRMFRAVKGQTRRVFDLFSVGRKVTAFGPRRENPALGPHCHPARPVPGVVLQRRHLAAGACPELAKEWSAVFRPRSAAAEHRAYRRRSGAARARRMGARASANPKHPATPADDRDGCKTQVRRLPKRSGRLRSETDHGT